MPSRKLIFVIKTNWIHVVAFYVCVEVFMLVPAIVQLLQHQQLKLFLGQALFPAFLLLFGYGLFPLIGFYIIILLLDLVLFAKTNLPVFKIILIEWAIIAPIFIYWAFIYRYWLWLALAASFYLTQVVRARRMAFSTKF